jgi:hypothetical protein
VPPGPGGHVKGITGRLLRRALQKGKLDRALARRDRIEQIGNGDIHPEPSGNGPSRWVALDNLGPDPRKLRPDRLRYLLNVLQVEGLELGDHRSVSSSSRRTAGRVGLQAAMPLIYP